MDDFLARRNTQESFRWIVDVLKKRNVPFAISGGLAASAYGSPRPLNDIDIDIPSSYFSAILSDIRPFITFGPKRFVDQRWDLELATLNHRGQEIDLGGSDTVRICDARTGNWVHMPTNYDEVVEMQLFGRCVPIVSAAELIAYKSMLSGAHQRIDIEVVLKNTQASGSQARQAA